jgi:hypothetical protein
MHTTSPHRRVLRRLRGLGKRTASAHWADSRSDGFADLQGARPVLGAVCSTAMAIVPHADLDVLGRDHQGEGLAPCLVTPHSRPAGPLGACSQSANHRVALTGRSAPHTKDPSTRSVKSCPAPFHVFDSVKRARKHIAVCAHPSVHTHTPTGACEPVRPIAPVRRHVKLHVYAHFMQRSSQVRNRA